MYIEDIIWLDKIVEKLEGKHHISPEEVEEVFYNEPHIRRAQKGMCKVKICIMPMVKQIVGDTSLWYLCINGLAKR